MKLGRAARIALVACMLGLPTAACGNSLMMPAASGLSEVAYGAADSAALDRKIVRTADLRVTLDDPDGGAREAQKIVEAAAGFVERSQTGDDERTTLTARVPADRLDSVMDAIAALGEEQQRSVSATDVTEQAADFETRIRTNSALRDRMRALLERATNVEDVLAVEKELSRLQLETEAMQGRLERLESQVAMSSLQVSFERERILGPLGFVAYGLWWVVEKLFVIR